MAYNDPKDPDVNHHWNQRRFDANRSIASDPPYGMAWLLAGDNRAVLNRIGFFVIMTLVIASMSPGPIMPVMVANLMLFAAGGTAVVALLSGERLMKSVLGRWDEAAFYALMSLVSIQTINFQALEQLRQQSGLAS